MQERVEEGVIKRQTYGVMCCIHAPHLRAPSLKSKKGLRIMWQLWSPKAPETRV